MMGTKFIAAIAIAVAAVAIGTAVSPAQALAEDDVHEFDCEIGITGPVHCANWPSCYRREWRSVGFRYLSGNAAWARVEIRSHLGGVWNSGQVARGAARNGNALVGGGTEIWVDAQGGLRTKNIRIRIRIRG